MRLHGNSVGACNVAVGICEVYRDILYCWLNCVLGNSRAVE